MKHRHNWSFNGAADIRFRTSQFCRCNTLKSRKFWHEDWTLADKRINRSLPVFHPADSPDFCKRLDPSLSLPTSLLHRKTQNTPRLNAGRQSGLVRLALSRAVADRSSICEYRRRHRGAWSGRRRGRRRCRIRRRASAFRRSSPCCLRRL